MPNRIYLRVDSKGRPIDPGAFVGAVKSFWGILQDLDSALSQDRRGSIYWGITSIQRTSPAIIAFTGESQLIAIDHTAEVHHACIVGMRRLGRLHELLPSYSDAALNKVKRLAGYMRAKARKRLDLLEVYSDNADLGTVSLSPELASAIESILTPRYESEGSVVGNLDSVTIHSGTEFRVWEEVTSRAVTCHFLSGQLEMVRNALGTRVLVHGHVRANYQGHPVRIHVEGIEPYPADVELPSIEEMSGLVPDFTGGVSLKQFMEELRSG